MKKAFVVVLVIWMLLLTSCSQEEGGRYISKSKTVEDILNAPSEAVTDASENYETFIGSRSDKKQADVDLTELSSTMVYSEVYNMIVSPDQYKGKTVRMNGTMAVSKGENQTYYACIIKDATACCAQGIEFILDEGDYPEEGKNITVYGTFNFYQEGLYRYCQLKNAVLEE